nr:hypothetical protein [Tanacetum cinerariifolium]
MASEGYGNKIIQGLIIEVNLRGLLELDKSELSERFVTSELPDDAIGIYHRIFDFSGVRVPFSLFLLLEPTVTLFRVFQALCKQGDWFSFVKHRAPFPVCIDDNHSSIDDPRPVAGSFNMADVHHLSIYVIKLRDMPEGVLVLSGLSRVWKNHFCDPVLLGADGNVREFMIFSTFLSGSVLSSKILAKAEAFQKRKASTFGAASSHVAKRTRPALAQLSGSTTRPNLFVGDDESDDDDACMKIPLVTPLCSAVVIPSSGTMVGASLLLLLKALTPKFVDSHGKGIMVDDVVAPSGGFPTPGEMVRVEGLSDDQLTAKMSMLHCMMISHGGKLLTRYRGLNQSHHEYVLSTESRLKGYDENIVAGLTRLELQVSTLKKHVSGLNNKRATSDASFAKSKAKGKEIKKKINSLSKSLDNFHSDLEHEKLVCPDNVPIPRDTRVSPPIAKDSTMTPVSNSLELSANVAHVSYFVASEQNVEQVNVVVDGSDLEMPDGAAPSKSGGVFVQGVSHVLDDVLEATAV